MGLIVAAAFTTALALCGLIPLLRKPDNRRAALLAFLVALPLQPLAYFFVRAPVDGALKAAFGVQAWMAVLAMFYAPLTEEPAKWLTATIPAVHRAIQSQPVRIALATGLGFGIGEIGFVTFVFMAQGNVPSAPPWAFWGLLIERLEVCFLHGAFVALPFVQLARGRSFLLGGLAGMTLHFLLNCPIFLARLDVFGLGTAWMPVLLLWVMGFVVLGAVMTFRLARVPIAAARRS